MGVEKMDNVLSNDYPALFKRHIAARAQYMLGCVQQDSFVVSSILQEKLLFVLQYACQSGECWSVTRDLLLAASPKMEQVGYRGELVNFLLKGIELSQLCKDQRAGAELSLNIGYLYFLQSEYHQALEYFMKGQRQFQLMNDIQGQAAAINYIALLKLQLKDFKQAKKFSLAALGLLEEENPERASSYYVLGEIAQQSREWPLAESYFKQALDLRQKHADERKVALGYHNLGRVLCAQKKFPEAIVSYEKALDIFIASNDILYIAVTQMSLGIVCSLRSQPADALAKYQLAESILREVKSDLWLARLYTNMAIEYNNAIEYQNAEKACLASMALWHKQNNIQSVLNAQDELGLAYLGQKNYAQALHTFEDALNQLEKADNITAKERLKSLLIKHKEQTIQRGWGVRRV